MTAGTGSIIGDFPPYCTWQPWPGYPPVVVPDYPQGWLCPRCSQIWAPWVAKCDCPVPSMAISANDTYTLTYPPDGKTFVLMEKQDE